MNLRRRNLLATVFLIALLLALPAIAAIQTVWLNSASRGEADRMRRGLSNATRQIRADLSVELASIAALMTPRLGDDERDVPTDIAYLSDVFPEFYAAWRDQSRFPGLVSDIVYIGPLGNETPYRYDPAAELFVSVAGAGSDWLEKIIAELSSETGPPQLDSSDLVLLLPLSQFVERVSIGGGSFSVNMVDPGYLVVRLDRDYLARVVLPQLIETYLGVGEYRAAVIDQDSGVLVWASFDTDYASAAGPDAPHPDERVAITGWPVSPFGAGDPGGRVTQPDFPAGLAERFQDPVLQQWLEFRRRGDGNDDEGTPAVNPPAPDSGGLTALIWHNAGSVEEAARIGRNRNLLFSYLALSVLAGSAIGYYILFRRANRLREREHEFVASVTHELRTPVAAIHAVADNLAEGIVTHPEQVREYGRAMLDEGRRLRAMIDQVLLYAGLQGGGSRRLTDIRIEELVDRTCARVPGLGPDRFTRRVERDMTVFRGDPVAIESVIRNLLSNAAKHNPAATHISLDVRSDHGGGGQRAGRAFNLVIEVRDNGRGIPRRELALVREPFFRGAQSQAEQIPGSGLGLSLVKRIADTYGGSLTVTSAAGEGTTVVVRLAFGYGEKRGTEDTDR